MKKTFALFALLLFMVGMVACDKTTTEVDTTSNQTTAEQVDTTAVEDLSPEFIGVADIQIEEGETVDFLNGITVVDSEDGSLTSSITVDSTGFDNETIGTYTINLSVTDSGENTVTTSYSIVVIEHVKTPEELAAEDIAAITLDPDNLVLPRLGDNRTKFYWATNNERVVTETGFVMKPSVGEDAVTVTLTLTAKNGDYTTTKDFDLLIESYSEVEVTSKVQLAFEGTSEEYVVPDDDEVNIFYVDNGEVPYVDVEEFIQLLNGAIETSIIDFSYPEEDVMRVSYEIEYLDIDEVTTITESYYAIIDFTENTFTVNNYDFFSGYIASTESDYGDGLIYADASYVDGNEVTIPLGFYNFDLVIYEENNETYHLMPLHVANRLFAGDIYYDVYYNGDKLWGIDTFVMSSGDDPDLLDLVRTSSFNTATASEDMKRATYNFMAFTMDYFYGLKPDKGYDTYYDVMYSRAESYITGSDRNLYQMVFKEVTSFDDLHSWHEFSGYYENPAYSDSFNAQDYWGSRVSRFYSGLWAIQDDLEEKYGSAEYPNDYTLLDNNTVAVIHITGFDIDTPDSFKAILDALPTTVEDVVIDLAYNTGGNIGAVMRIFGYMTEEQFMYHSQNPADGSAVTYYIESDYVAYDYNWYVLTSSVTFSAANQFASMAKELGIPVIGQDSSGGASSIGVAVLPDGSAMFMSTNNVLSVRVGNETDGYQYLSVEDGVEVDYHMDNVFDDEKLVTLINQISQ